MTRSLSAPGKLLLAGEYAVLQPGRSCLVAAVDRRLHVRVNRSDAWSAAHGSARWREGEPVPEALRFVVAAMDMVRVRGALKPLHLETSDLMRFDGRKLGLGGSAASTVAAALAAGGETGISRDELWALCDQVHRAVQGGKGSGADVAASVFGGVLRYSREPHVATPIAVHPELRVVAVWAGESVKTAPRLERFHAFVDREPAWADAWANRSESAVRGLSIAVASGDLEAMRASMAQARAALVELGEACGLDLETERLRNAADLAFAHGACGKLSGAGGGDCAVALTMGDDHASRLVEEYAKAGLPAFVLPIASEGARVEPE